MFMDLGAKDESSGIPAEVKAKYMFVKELGRYLSLIAMYM